MGGWIDGWMYVCLERGVNELMDGCRDGWMDGGMVDERRKGKHKFAYGIWYSNSNRETWRKS